MSTFEYILAHTDASTYNGETTILVKNNSNPNPNFDAIGPNAFEGLITTGSVSLEFESGSICKYINNNAFKNCPGLTSVTFPPSLQDINAQAFRLDAAPTTGQGLSSVTFTDIANSGLLIIRAGAFYLQSHLTSITLPKSLTNIVNQAFFKCGLQTLTIEPSDTTGSSLVGIEPQAFQDNNGMTVNINRVTATTIGATHPSQSTSFFGAENVITVNYPNTFNYKAGGGNATPSSDYNGENTILIVNWTNSSGDVAIPANAFEGLISPSGPHPPVGSVSLVFENASQPASNTVLINDKAFNNCPSLTSVTFPISLTGIGNNAFTFSQSFLPIGGGGLTSVIFTNISNSGLLSIANAAFQYQSNLTSITLPKSLKAIKQTAFDSTGLKTLTIEPSGSGSSLVKADIYTDAFSNINEMTVNINKATANTLDITLPSKTTSFFGANGVTTVNYPNTYEYTSGTTDPSTDYNGENTILVKNSGNPVMGSVYGVGPNQINGSFQDKIIASYAPVSLEFESVSTITEIYNKTFFNCPGLTSVTFPTSLTKIAYDVFQTSFNPIPNFSGGLTSVIFTDIANSSLTDIFSSAFQYQSNLKSIKLPKSLQTIGQSAFGGTGLKTLTIEPSGNLSSLNTSTSINPTAFSGVPDKMTVHIYNATASNINIPVPSNSTTFYGANEVITVNYPDIFFHIDGVTDSSDYNGESSLMVSNTAAGKVSANSYNGKMLSSYPPVSLGFDSPSYTTTIEDSAFANTPSLKSMSVPNSLKSIAPNAFSSSGLQFVTISKNNGLGVKVQPGKQVSFYGATVVMSLPAGEILEISTDIIFPYPKNEKNKRLLGVNQKISSGLARPNFKFQTNQFSAGRSRTAQSKQKANGPYTVIFPIR